MNLYLVHNDPERTTLVSSNGVAQYQVRTIQKSLLSGSAVSTIIRPAPTARESIVAEIEWRAWGKRPIVRSNVFDGTAQELPVDELLFKSSSTKFSALRDLCHNKRYFLGNDDHVYCWRVVKGIGSVLTCKKTGEEVARFTEDVVEEGFFRRQKKWFLQIQPSTLDIDMVVITFIIMEKRRRDKVTDPLAVRVLEHDEDPGEGGGIEG
ncbi:uncharacterized protein C8Q71DRAFT_231617 [Rhodofomes roseus]|uniref:DUF6593 domain-containing protein n=1 Tax=Rhodofomes roseus TaxID=34475 RepID=A0ABQ8KVE3_9APHY|nr:uncharacterized protein C8Q71DRAFT_231617 [Rhodofomes roseus]KAH9843006.1 hypothetical protein C8Q71DRAFT_231617 [Rhodofomes roseus]